MKTDSKNAIPYPKRQKQIRRRADKHLQDRLEKFSRLIQAGQIITAELNFDSLFEVVSDQLRKILNVERCSIFLIDEGEQNLCPYVAADLDAKKFQFSKEQGIAGWVFCNRTSQIVNNAYEDPRFNKEIDQKTGFSTINILCVPLLSHNRNCIGTMQVLNKQDGPFTEEDAELVTYIASYVTVAIENSYLVEELIAIDRARQKAVNHLSHELKTPLSILTAVMKRIALTAHEYDLNHLIKTIERGQRSLDRLSNIQEKVEDIVGRKIVDCKKLYVHLFEDLIDLINEAGEDPAIQSEQLATCVVQRIQSILGFEDVKLETIRVDPFLRLICDATIKNIGNRDLDISAAVEDELYIATDKTILKKVCDGLLKNAIENTPDEGRIVIKAAAQANTVSIVFQDFGVGITKENQKNIFTGFFHTQATDQYSSKMPYAFNAGGTGTDLLRMRTFAERLGFSIDFSSRRCRFIPNEADVCPGKISLCGTGRTADACMDSGGSKFTVKFSKVGNSIIHPSIQN